MTKDKVPTAERVGAAVAGILIVAAVTFTVLAPSDGANIGGGMLTVLAALVGAACYGVGKLLGNRRS